MFAKKMVSAAIHFKIKDRDIWIQISLIFLLSKCALDAFCNLYRTGTGTDRK